MERRVVVKLGRFVDEDEVEFNAVSGSGSGLIE